MREFEILERKNDYFLCRKESGFCRIIIDNNSQNLPLGKVMLHAEEISDRYIHFANDSIFRLTAPFEQMQNIGICTLHTGYRKNVFIYKRCLQLGGKWEPILNEWVFANTMQKQVNELSSNINAEPIYIEVRFHETITTYDTPLTLFGYPLIQKIHNNNLLLHKDIQLVAGDIALIPTDQFNSKSNQKTIIVANSIIRLLIPSKFLKNKFFREDYLASVTITQKRKPKHIKS